MNYDEQDYLVEKLKGELEQVSSVTGLLPRFGEFIMKVPLREETYQEWHERKLKETK